MQFLPMKRIIAILSLALAAILSPVPLPAMAAPANWLTTVTQTPEGSHVIGNPAAATTLTEYVSYTCPHCAHFTQEAEAPIGESWVASGKLKVEVRHLLRDSFDLTVALLTNCGPKEKFPGNHSLLMREQEKWIKPATAPSEELKKRWSTANATSRARFIAADLGLYTLMASRGYSKAELDRCLSDDAMLKRLATQTEAALKAGVDSTPSFAINGVILTGTHDWAMLQPQLQARLH